MSTALLLAGLLAAEPILDVSVDPAIDDADQVKQWVTGEGDAALKRRDVDPDGGGGTGWKIDIDVGGATYDYRIAFELTRGGERLVDQPDVFTCECSNEQLIEELKPTLEHVLDLMETSDTVSEEDTGADTGSADTGPDPTDGTEGADNGRLGKMGKAGVALIPIGAVALGVGIGLVVTGEKEEAGDQEGDASVTDFRPPGYALLAAGGAVLVVGIALLVADRVKAKRRRTTFVPRLGPTYAGAAATVRF